MSAMSHTPQDASLSMDGPLPPKGPCQGAAAPQPPDCDGDISELNIPAVSLAMVTQQTTKKRSRSQSGDAGHEVTGRCDVVISSERSSQRGAPPPRGHREIVDVDNDDDFSVGANKSNAMTVVSSSPASVLHQSSAAGVQGKTPISPSCAPTDIVCQPNDDITPSKSMPSAPPSTAEEGAAAGQRRRLFAAPHGSPESPTPKNLLITPLSSAQFAAQQSLSEAAALSSKTPVTAQPPQQKKEMKQRTLDFFTPTGLEKELRKDIQDKDLRILELQSRVTTLESDSSRKSEFLIMGEIKLAAANARCDRFRQSLAVVMQSIAFTTRSEARRKQHSMHFELGHIMTIPSASTGQPKEMWVEGNRYRALVRETAEVYRRIAQLEAEKESLSAKIRDARKKATSTAVAEKEDSNGFGGVSLELAELEELSFACKHELDALHEAKERITQRNQEHEMEKKVFLKEIRRISDEDGSEFIAQEAIGEGGRYVLLNLLGKGGFSEVWKAFDLQEAMYVACKIHKVSREMSPQQKAHYLRHAQRELDIMRQLNHPRLTRLYDVFTHNSDTFVAVMEYCGGTDLDTHLKANGTMKENDARAIMVQIIAALRHMCDQENPVIHYDLKPANILFASELDTCLDIKITDFGLSKIIENARASVTSGKGDFAIELTSQGTGTYWYLPPECFDTTQPTAPIISTKVDVWAAGIIFYQMLFGKRPFAEGASQRQIWAEKLICQSAMKPLEFPLLPKVSKEAQEIIRRCLAPNVKERIDIFSLSQEGYFRKKVAPGRAVGSGASKLAAPVASAGSPFGGSDMPPPS